MPFLPPSQQRQSTNIVLINLKFLPTFIGEGTIAPITIDRSWGHKVKNKVKNFLAPLCCTTKLLVWLHKLPNIWRVVQLICWIESISIRSYLDNFVTLNEQVAQLCCVQSLALFTQILSVHFQIFRIKYFWWVCHEFYPGRINVPINVV